jgi:hypothetical protein
MSRVRLTRKLALVLNGVDVSRFSVGDVFEVTAEQADMLVENGWAEAVPMDLVPVEPSRKASQNDLSD